MSKKSESPEPTEIAADVTADLVGAGADEPAVAEAPSIFADAADAPTAAHTQVTPAFYPAPPGAVPPGAIPPGAMAVGAVPDGSADSQADEAASKARKRTFFTALIGAGVGLIAGLSLGIGGTLLASDDHDGHRFDSGQMQGPGGRHGDWDQQQGNQQQGNQQQGNQQQGGRVQPGGQQQGGFDQQNGAVPGAPLPGQGVPGGMSRSGGS